MAAVPLGEELAGQEEAFAEVAGYDPFGVADRGEIDTGVPPHEYIDVRRYTREQRRSVIFSGEGGQQLGYPSGVHGGRL